MSEHRFRISQGGLVVAEVHAPTYDRGLSEIIHYARQYASEGPMEIQERANRRWRKLPDHPPHPRDRTAMKDPTPPEPGSDAYYDAMSAEIDAHPIAPRADRRMRTQAAEDEACKARANPKQGIEP